MGECLIMSALLTAAKWNLKFHSFDVTLWVAWRINYSEVLLQFAVAVSNYCYSLYRLLP